MKKDYKYIFESSTQQTKQNLSEIITLTKNDIIPIKEGQENKSNSMKFKQKLIECDVPGINRRVYPKDEMENAISRIIDRQKSKQLLGELDHPTGDDDRSFSISIKEQSHQLIDFVFEGNTLMGIIEVLNTPNGEIVKNIINQGIPLGLSLRGFGQEEQQVGSDGYEIYNVSDLELVTWDIVSNPSYQITHFNKSNLIERIVTNSKNKLNKIKESDDFKAQNRQEIDSISSSIIQKIKYDYQLNVEDIEDTLGMKIDEIVKEFIKKSKTKNTDNKINMENKDEDYKIEKEFTLPIDDQDVNFTVKFTPSNDYSGLNIKYGQTFEYEEQKSSSFFIDIKFDESMSNVIQSSTLEYKIKHQIVEEMVYRFIESLSEELDLNEQNILCNETSRDFESKNGQYKGSTYNINLVNFYDDSYYKNRKEEVVKETSKFIIDKLQKMKISLK